MTQVFISYSRKDLTFVERLAKDLKSAGLEVWYDLSGLDAGTRWGREIQSAIQQSQIFVVILSPNSVESQWVEREFMYAESLKKKIIPLLFQPCETPMWFINLHFIDVQGTNYESHFWVILKAMGVETGSFAAKIEPGVAASSKPMPPEILEPLPRVVEQEQRQPSRTPVKQKSREKKESSATQGTVELKPLLLPWKIKIRPVWIITLVGLIAVAAFAIWGASPLAAWLAPTLAPSITATRASTPTPTMTDTHSLTATFTHTAASLPTFTPSPTLGIGSTWTSPMDGMVMLYVPKGNFAMGAAAGTGRVDEYPQHTVYLDAFWMDKTDVTNAMYANCVSAGSCQPPPDITNPNALYHASYYADPQYENFPVVYTFWELADNYCKWAGERLPTEAEWEKAARGTDGRIYPWGNSSPNCNLANYSGCTGDTTAVDSHTSGASPFGVLDMAGNVWQWVADWYDPGYYANSPLNNPSGPSSGQFKVLRGGAYNYNEGNLRSVARFRNDPGDWNHQLIGFRCARSSQ